MIILVTLMVVASRVLSVQINDIPDSNYVAIDPSEALPVQIDPATITRLFRDQSSHPGSIPPFNEGFYYTAPARLLLYQPPPGQSYPPGGAKKRGNCDKQPNPIKIEEYVQSSHQRQFKRSNDKNDIPPNLLPPNALGPGIQYVNYHDSFSNQLAGYQKLNPSKFSSTGGMWANPQENVGEWAGRANPGGIFPDTQRHYSHSALAPQLEPRQGTIMNSQLRGQHSGSGSQFPLYENENFRQYGRSFSLDGYSGTGTGVESIHTDLNHEYQNRIIPDVASQQFKTIAAHRGDVIGDKNVNVDPYSSQISPSYIVGFKLFTKTQPSANADLPIWASPNFPKHMVEPWGSKMNADGVSTAHSISGLQPRPIESSRAVAGDMTSIFRLMPPLHNDAGAIKSKTPWFVLMVPQDSLFRKDYLGKGVKTPWVSLAPRTYGAHDPAKPICQNENLNIVESQVIPASEVTEMKETLMPDLQNPAAGSLEAHPLLEEESVNGATSGARSLLTTSTTTTEPKTLSQPSLTPESQGETVGIISPSIGTIYIPGRSGTQELFEYNSKDQVNPLLEGTAGMVGEGEPMSEVQTIINEVSLDGSSLHGMASDSQILTGQSNDIKQMIEVSPTVFSGIIHGNGAQVVTEGLIQGPAQVAEVSLGPQVIHDVVIEQGKVNSQGMLFAGASSPMMVTTPSVGLAAHHVIEQSNDDESAIASTPSTSQTVQYVSSGGAVEESLERKMETYTVGSLVTEDIRTDVPSLQTTLESGHLPSQVVTYAIEGGTGMSEDGNMVGSISVPQVAEQPNTAVSTTTLSDGAPSTTKVLHYIASEGAKQGELGEASIELKVSSKEEHYSPENSGTQQIIEEYRSPENLTFTVDGQGSTSQVVQEDLPTASSNDYSYNNGQQRLTSAEESSGLNVGSATAHSSKTPTTGKVFPYVTSADGVTQEVTGADLSGDIVLETGNSSTITQLVAQESPVTQKINVEQARGEGSPSQVLNNSGSLEVADQYHSLGTATNLVSGAPSMNEIIHHITTPDSMRQEIIEEAAGVASEIENHSTVTQYDFIGGTSPQQVAEETNDHGLTTTSVILSGLPKTEEIIQQVTADNGKLRPEVAAVEELAKAKIAPGNEGSFTVADYVPSVSAVTEQIIEVGQGPHTISTMVDGGATISQVVGNETTGSSSVTSNETNSNLEGRNEVETVVAQDHNTGGSSIIGIEKEAGSSTIILGEVPSTLSTPNVEEAVPSSKTRTGKSEIQSESAGAQPVTEYINPRSIVDHVIEESDSQAEIAQKGKALPSTQKVDYETKSATDLNTQDVVHESSGTLQVVEHPSAVGSTSLMTTPRATPRGIPITQKIIRIITTPDGEQKEELVDESTLELPNESHLSGVAHQSATTLVAPLTPKTTKKLISYMTSADGEQREGIVDETSQALDTVDVPSDGVPLPTTALKTGAPAAKKIIRYLTTADGQRQEIVDEPSLAIENGEPSEGITQSATTIKNGGTTTKKIIQYITTANGQRQEIIEEPSLSLGNGGLATTKTPVTHQQIIRIITTPDGERREEIVDEPSLALETVGVPSGGVPLPTTTLTTGTPTAKKIIRYITTADGQRQEIVDEPSLVIENGGLASGAVTQSATTIKNGGTTAKKIIRYITTSDGQRQEIIEEPSLAFENGAIASGIVPQPISSIATAKTPVTHQKIIRIITTPNGEHREEIVDQSTLALETGGLSSIAGHYTNNGAGGTQHIIGTGGTQQLETIPSAGASTSKVLRYVTKGGGLHQEIPGSHIINGQGSLQSSDAIVGGSPSTISRFMNYPQQSGLSGTHYMQGFQPRQTSNVIKPASYIAGALPGSASSNSYVA